MLQTISMWRSIASDIEQKIKSRELSPGDKLPTEHELALRFMVNRHTVRRALAHLQAKGLVESTQGRGSFVRRPALAFRIAKRTRFSETMKHLGATHRFETISVEVQPADARVAAFLGLRFGQPVIVLERLGFANDEPVSISRHYFSQERFPLFLEMYGPRQSITATLRDSGVPDYVRARTSVLSRLPTPQECDLLKMPRHVPVLITQSLNHDGLGRPLEFGEARFAADRIELMIEPDSPSPSA